KSVIQRLNMGLTFFFIDNLAENIYLPAERIGINVFRTRLNNQVVNENFSNPVEALTSKTATNERYPYPIEDYIKYLNNSLTYLDHNYDQQMSVSERDLLSKLIPGHFFYSEDLNQIRYRLPGDTTQEISFNLVSSSLKSLLGIETFVKHHDTFSWLLIDEPEMNLHPTRQAMMANLLYQLAKGNTRVVVSTHSDYFIKALINDILASKVADKEKHIGMTTDVSIYEFTNNSVRQLGDLTDETAFTNFDETTDKINTRYYDLLDQLDEEDAGPADE
ncbi:AAA family ATPase, partial [Levilactobacillus brevis]|uniref:AAA family ATPase n=1 Tax=Levilactobacillus brevis TaxID=1580 RepID=UPI001C1ECDDE